MKRPGKALLRGLLGLFLLGLVMALTDPARVLAQLRQAQPVWLLVGLLAAILVAMIVYFIACLLLRVKELGHVVVAIAERFHRRRPA